MYLHLPCSNGYTDSEHLSYMKHVTASTTKKITPNYKKSSMVRIPMSLALRKELRIA